MWLCECVCGGTNIVTVSCLNSGNTTSCGCRQLNYCTEGQQTHGRSKDRVYGVWNAMKQRCSNPKDKKFPLYGGRGISVCPAWIASFETFISDMGERPTGRFTIERLDSNGDYSPENCVWATYRTQGQNTSSNHNVTIGLETKCLREWARDPKCTVRWQSIRSRLLSGMSTEDAVFLPPQ